MLAMTFLGFTFSGRAAALGVGAVVVIVLVIAAAYWLLRRQ